MSLWDVCAREQSNINYLVYRKGHEYWDEYKSLICTACQKLSKEEILRIRHLPEDLEFRIRSGTDFFQTNEWIPGFSRTGMEKICAAGIEGFDFVALPNNTKYVLAFPKIRAELDPSKSGMKVQQQCAECGRTRITGFTKSFALQLDPADRFSNTVFTTNPLKVAIDLLCLEATKERLASLKLRGMSFEKIDE